MENKTEYPIELKTIAHAAVKDLGYKLKKFNPGNYVAIFHKDGGNVKVNVYWKKNFRSSFTVQTTIDHPTKKRNQLNRRGLTFKEVISVLKNPRLHTGKGYRKA